MSAFKVFPANPVRFSVNTGTGRIMDGETILDNFLYHPDHAPAGFSTDVIEETMWEWYAQPWKSGAEMRIVIESDAAGSFFLYVCDDALEILQKVTAASLGNDRFQFVFNLSNEGTLYISQSDQAVAATLAHYEAISEPVVFRDDLVEVVYWNNYNGSLNAYYDSTLTLTKSTAYLPGKLTRPKNTQTREQYVNSAGELINVVNESAKVRTLYVDRVPEYFHDIIVYILQHQNITILGVEYVQEEDYEQEDIEETSLVTAGVRLKDNTSIQEVNFLLDIEDTNTPAFTFETNKNGTFNPTISKSGVAATWIFADGTSIVSNNPSKVLDGSTQTVKVYLDDVTTVTAIDFTNQRIVNTLTLPAFTNCLSYGLANNPGMTALDTSACSGTVDFFSLSDNTGLTGNLDVSTLNLNNTVYLSNVGSSGLITNSSNTGVITDFRANGADFAGVLDLSDYDLNTRLWLFSMDNVTGFVFAPNTDWVTGLRIFDNFSLTALDFSNINIRGSIDGRNCTSLTSLSFKAYSTAQTVTFMSFFNTQISGNVDLTMFTFSTAFLYFGDSFITGITFNAANQLINLLSLGNANLTGNLDWSNIECTSVDVSGNAGLTGINFRATSVFTLFKASETDNIDIDVASYNTGAFGLCEELIIREASLSVDNINNILTELETNGGVSPSVPATTDWDFGGTGNAAPTSGPPDGLTAKANLIQDGYTVTTN